MTNPDSQDPIPSVTPDQLRSVTGGFSLASIGGLFGAKGTAVGGIVDNVISLFKSNKAKKAAAAQPAQPGGSASPTQNMLLSGDTSAGTSEAGKLTGA